MTDKEKKVKYQNMLDMIGALESNNDYNIMYGEKESTNNLIGMTIDEVIAFQDNIVKERGESAAGKYQIISSTLKGLKENLKLKGDELFNEEMQDNMAVSLLDGRGYDKYLNGEISQEEFTSNVTKEWDALPKNKDAIGRKVYTNLDGSDRRLTTLDFNTFQDVLSKSKGTDKDNTPVDVTASEKSSSLLDGLNPPGSIDLDTFNFGIKKEGAFGDFKLNRKPDATIKPKTTSEGSITKTAQQEDEYLKSIQKNKNIGTGIEVGKFGANLSSYMRNQRTKAPTPLKSKNIPLLDKSFMNADYSQINQDVVRMLGATREAGGDQGNINQLLRGSTDAKTKLGATVNQFNLAEKGRVDAANIGIMEKNIGNKLNTDVYNRNVNLKLAEQKGLADTALMQGMFDNVTNMAAYRAKAATETEANKRYLKEFKQENDRMYIR